MLKHMVVIGRLMNIIEFVNKDGLKLRPLWSVGIRMSPATRREPANRTHEKRNPRPGITGAGGCGGWCGGGCV